LIIRCLQFLFLFYLHIGLRGQDICDIHIYLKDQTVSYDTDEVCLTLQVDGFTDIKEFELSISYPPQDVTFDRSQNIHPDLSNLDIESGAGTLILDWASNDPVSLQAQATIVELCFSIFNFPDTGIEINIDGAVLDLGNNIANTAKDLRPCVQNGRIKTPCSLREFEIHPSFQFNNFTVCRNDTIDTNYPFHKHPQEDLPLTVQIYKDGSLHSETIYSTLDFFAGYVRQIITAGNYSFVVTNGDGCMDSTSFVVQSFGDGIFNAEGGLAWNRPMVTHTCAGIDEGRIEISVFSGVDSMVWDHGVTTKYNSLGTHILDGLGPGVYVGYRELLDCRATATIEVQDIPTYEVHTNVHPASCDGRDGAAWITFDPRGDYQVTWEGNTTEGPILTDLAPGNYIATIINPEGCTVQKEIEVPISGALELEWETAVSYPDCNVNTPATRSISINSTHIGAVDFRWSSGEMSSGTSSTATLLDHGRQWVFATSTSCRSDTIFFDVPQQETFSVSIDSSESTLVLCQRQLASVVLAASDTIGLRVLDTGGRDHGTELTLEVGTHVFSAVNERGCTLDIQIQIKSALPQFDILGTIPASLCPEQQEEISITTIGPQSNIGAIRIANNSYAINAPIILDTGSYNISIESESGCTWDTSFVISTASLDIILPSEVRTIPDNEISISTSTLDPYEITYDWISLNELNCINDDCSEVTIRAKIDETIYLYAINEVGCTFRDSTVLVIASDTTIMDTNVRQDDELFYIPNIVNLQGGAHNSLCIHLTNVVASITSLAIYDRWGNIMNELIGGGTERVQCLNDEATTQLQAGVYIYLLELMLANGQQIVRSGDVTLIR